MAGSADTTREIADLYAFLSGVLADPPDEAAVRRLVNEEFPPDASPQSLANGYRLLTKWQASVDDPEEEAYRLKKVFTELFVGPRPRMQIHESWYADDYMGKPLATIKDTYRNLGIQEAADIREEVDHAAVEFAALEMLARDGADDFREAFLEIHGWWFPALATDIQEMSDDQFYEAIGWIIEGTIEADAYMLGLDTGELQPGYLDSA